MGRGAGLRVRFNVSRHSRGQAGRPGDITILALKCMSAVLRMQPKLSPSCEEVLPVRGRCLALYSPALNKLAHRAGQRPRLPFRPRGGQTQPPSRMKHAGFPLLIEIVGWDR